MTPPTLHSPLATRGKAASAFTLLEVILAVTIAGALLSAAAALLVSVTDIWIERQDRHFFEDHVDGVTEFLQASFSNAGTEVTISDKGKSDSGEDSGGTGLVRLSEEPISWSKPPGYADYEDPLLHFSLQETPPLLIQTGNAPVIGIEAFLRFKPDEGLSLLWYSPLQEDTEDINDLRRTPISDRITQVEYIYWDEDFEKWEPATKPKEGEGDEPFILPRFLKLTFKHEGETKVRTLTIPIPSQSALIF